MSFFDSSTFDQDALVSAAQGGDKDAFGQLYDGFFEKIYRYVHYRVPAKEVDDLVELVFMKAWMNLERYEKRDVPFGAWIFRIAHNVVIDFRRQHRSLLELDEQLPDLSEVAAPSARTHRKLVDATVRDEVEQLKEPYRQVITLKFLMGLSNEEVAQVLGEREGHVRVMQFRALKMLKDRLAEKGIQKEFL